MKANKVLSLVSLFCITSIANAGNFTIKNDLTSLEGDSYAKVYIYATKMQLPYGDLQVPEKHTATNNLPSNHPIFLDAYIKVKGYSLKTKGCVYTLDDSSNNVGDQLVLRFFANENPIKKDSVINCVWSSV
ncbi:MAG: hypothetical protein H0W64_11535 [Gammaproteobacteria bacterium]|nr:hypothetical protein [Gammaproteobacteria bacterium]